jgi:hypothetical protein
MMEVGRFLSSLLPGDDGRWRWEGSCPRCYLEMMDDGGGEVLVLADEERHCPLPEGEGDERALLQRAAVLEVGQPKVRHLAR